MIKEAFVKGNEILSTLLLALLIAFVWCCIFMTPLYFLIALTLSYGNWIFWLLILLAYPLFIFYVLFWMYTIKLFRRYLMKWISVCDELPESDIEVVVCDGNSKVSISFFNGYNFTEPYGGYCIDNVTHWMPLPAPPTL